VRRRDSISRWGRSPSQGAIWVRGKQAVADRGALTVCAETCCRPFPPRGQDTPACRQGLGSKVLITAAIGIAPVIAGDKSKHLSRPGAARPDHARDLVREVPSRVDSHWRNAAFRRCRSVGLPGDRSEGRTFLSPFGIGLAHPFKPASHGLSTIAWRLKEISSDRLLPGSPTRNGED
jgi:hypothetical protein